MSKRYFDTEFWNGDYVLELPPYEKLLYVYLINYPSSNIAGIIDYQPRRYSFETGIEQDIVEQIVQRLESDGKVKVLGKRLALLKWGKHQTKSPDVADGVARVLAGLSDEEIGTLRGTVPPLSPHSPYILPPGSTWKTILKSVKRFRGADNEISEGDSPPTVPPGSGGYHAPNLTLPNPTTLGGGGGVVGGETREPVAPRPPVVVLTEAQLSELDAEFPEVNIDDEYEKVNSNGHPKVNEPMAFMRARLSKIVASQRKGTK